MNFEEVYKTHEILLKRNCSHYEKALLQSGYFRGWGEALIGIEKLLGRQLTKEDMKILLDNSNQV